MIQAGSETADQVSAVNQALGLVQGLVCSLLLAYADSIKGHNHVGPANSGDLSGTEPFPPVPTHRSKALVPVRHTGPAMGVGLPHRVAVLLANTLAEFTGTEPELVVEEATGSMETELPGVSNRATVGQPGANPSGWGSARINSAQVTKLRAVTCESLALTDLDLWADSENSRVSSDTAASDTGGGGPSKVLGKSTKAVKSSFRTHEGRGNIRNVQAAAKRKGRQKWLRDRDDLAVRQDIVLRIERWAKSLVDKCHFREFTDVFSSKRLARFPKKCNEQMDGLSQPWAGGNVWLHPLDRLWEQTVQKLKFEQGRGIAIVPTCRDRYWWCFLGEVVVDWVDVPVGEPLFVDHDGKVRSADREYRIVVVYALGWTPEESQAEPVDAADKKRAVWDSTLPSGDCVALYPHDCTVSAPFSHTHPGPSLESLMHGTSNHQVQQVLPVQVKCRQMRRRAHREGTKRAKSGDIRQSESEASPGLDYPSMEESDTMHERPMVTTPR